MLNCASVLKKLTIGNKDMSQEYHIGNLNLSKLKKLEFIDVSGCWKNIQIDTTAKIWTGE